MMNDTSKRQKQFSTQIDKAFSGSVRHLLKSGIEVQRDMNRVMMTIEDYGDCVECPQGQDFDEWLGNSAKFARKFKQFATAVSGKPGLEGRVWARWEAAAAAARAAE